MCVSKAAVLLVACACMLALFGFGTPAQARIVCRGPAQVVDGTLISTPYCEDGYLAHVARTSYGMQVMAALLLSNPAAKEDVCLAIGRDTRIAHICAADGASLLIALPLQD